MTRRKNPEMLNASEAEALLQQRGIGRPGRGLGRESLLRALENGKVDGRNPVDDLRDELINLLHAKGERLKIIGCTRDCYDHGDAHVVYCYRHIVEKERKE